MKKMLLLTALLTCCGALCNGESVRAGGTGGGSSEPQGPVFTGKVTAVDPQAGTVTFTTKNNESHSVRVAASTRVQVNGKAGTLADLQVGMYGGVKMSADGQSVVELRAQDAGAGDANRPVYGKVSAVDVTAGTVTFVNKNNESNTVKVDGTTQIQVGGKAGAIADIKVGMYGGAKVNKATGVAVILRTQ